MDVGGKELRRSHPSKGTSMTPQQIEAMKLALEALKWCHGGEPCGTSEAITAIEEALAEHAMRNMQRLGQEIEQEPCGWQFFQGGKWQNGMETNNHRANTEAAGIPVRDVYPSPQRTEQNFCHRCGKRTKDIHTCTPPRENT